jgi:hypothetical protein
MPATEVLFFRESDGSVPVVEWLDALPAKVRSKCFASLIRLGQLGPDLRRPEADYLRDGMYELRVGFRGMNYRMLYFFAGKLIAVVSHGLTKERRVPPGEIDLALVRRARFLANPARHRFKPELGS